jgi:hypothetical protein
MATIEERVAALEADNAKHHEHIKKTMKEMTQMWLRHGVVTLTDAQTEYMNDTSE